ncbi:hypothetical protein, partial [Vibrio parahaemolyticus]|uniref:hypothetical protein n=1 Tax=Vibrio parahaemolyticus TaxID=670 RepID=UPI0004A440B5
LFFIQNTMRHSNAFEASPVIALFLPIFLFVPAKNKSEPTLAVAHKKTKTVTISKCLGYPRTKSHPSLLIIDNVAKI